MPKPLHKAENHGSEECACSHDDTVLKDVNVTFQNEKGKVIVQPPAGLDMNNLKTKKKMKNNITWSHAVDGYVGCEDLDTIMEHINNEHSSSNTGKRQTKNKKKKSKTVKT